MPSDNLMSWVSSAKRWQKQYKGKTYAVSCRQLNCKPTKADSKKAANEWWIAKQAEIDERLNARSHPTNIVKHYDEAIENHRIYATWHRQYGNPDLADKAEAVMEWLQESLKTTEPPFPLTKWQYDPAYEEKLDSEQYWVWRERKLVILREERGKQTPIENTIRSHIEQYLMLRESQEGVTQSKVGTNETFMHRLNVFKKWVPANAAIEEINEDLWERYYLHLVKLVENGEISDSHWSACLSVARTFIRSRWERRLIELPRNLSSLKASISNKPIIVFEDEEITARYSKADDRMRLFILLALNCGMYQRDIGDLRQSEVDWKAGRITRQRTKTRKRSKKVPTVNYKLWPSTFELLKEHRSEDSEFALLNQDGRPLWHQKRVDGKYRKSDAIKNLYFRLQRDELPEGMEHKPFKTFRKTSASRLEEHDKYGRYSEYFLGEAPSSITQKHYAVPSKKQFDAALAWLWEQLSDCLTEEE